MHTRHPFIHTSARQAQQAQLGTYRSDQLSPTSSVMCYCNIGATTPGHNQHCTSFDLFRASFEKMSQQAPKLLNLLQTITLRSTCLSVAHALEALERSGMD